MNWKAFWGILGLSVFIIYVASTIYQLINWDGVYWELIKNIVFCIVGLSLFMEWRKKKCHPVIGMESIIRWNMA